MSIHWILVGDAAGAKVYESDAKLEELVLVDTITVTNGHVRHDDGTNKSNEQLPGVGHDTEQAESDPHKESAERSARAVARSMNDAELHHRFEHLVLVAPPRFLGDLRAALSTNVTRKVTTSINHDWTQLSVRDLSEQLRKKVPIGQDTP